MQKNQAYQIIKDYFKDKPVSKVHVFGSYARNEQKQTSDIDIVIHAKQALGLFNLVRFKQDLTALLGISVDLTTEKGLSAYVLPFIQKDMEVVYEQ